LAKPTLAEYARKRDFSKTPEPAGQVEVLPSERLRFVIRSTRPRACTMTFGWSMRGPSCPGRSRAGPRWIPDAKRLAVETSPIRWTTATSKAPFPKGQYGGGTVMLWDRGFWEPDPEKPIEKGLEHGHLLGPVQTASG
jgi:bifunctional non-homologous end joining protein LigD